MTETLHHAKVRIEKVYGVRRIYPVNETAILLSELAGTKTLADETIAIAKKLGFLFHVEAPKI